MVLQQSVLKLLFWERKIPFSTTEHLSGISRFFPMVPIENVGQKSYTTVPLGHKIALEIFSYRHHACLQSSNKILPPSSQSFNSYILVCRLESHISTTCVYSRIQQNLRSNNRENVSEFLTKIWLFNLKQKKDILASVFLSGSARISNSVIPGSGSVVYLHYAKWIQIRICIYSKLRRIWILIQNPGSRRQNSAITHQILNYLESITALSRRLEPEYGMKQNLITFKLNAFTVCLEVDQSVTSKLE